MSRRIAHSGGWFAADQYGRRACNDGVGRPRAEASIAQHSGWHPSDQYIDGTWAYDRASNVGHDPSDERANVHISDTSSKWHFF